MTQPHHRRGRPVRWPVPLSSLAIAGLGAAAAASFAMPLPGAAQGVVVEGHASFRAGASASFRARVAGRSRRSPPPVAAPRRGPLHLPVAEAPAVEVPGRAGGAIPIRRLGAWCEGFVGPAPNHTLVVDGPRTTVRATVTSGPASVLLLRSPDGRLRCHGRSGGPAPGPGFTETLPAGRYQVFVGRPAPGFAAQPYMLRIETFAGPDDRIRRGARRPLPGPAVAPRPPSRRWEAPAPADGRNARMRAANLLDRPWTLRVDRRARPFQVVFHRDGRVTGHPRAASWSWSGRRMVVFARDGRPIARLRLTGVRRGATPTLRGRDRVGRELVLWPAQQRPRGRAAASRW